MTTEGEMVDEKSGLTQVDSLICALATHRVTMGDHGCFPQGLFRLHLTTPEEVTKRKVRTDVVFIVRFLEIQHIETGQVQDVDGHREFQKRKPPASQMRGGRLLNRQSNVLTCPSQHVHQCINGEFNGLLVDYVGNSRTCYAQDFRGFCLLQRKRPMKYRLV